MSVLKEWNGTAWVPVGTASPTKNAAYIGINGATGAGVPMALRSRELPGIHALPALNPSPPTLTPGVANAASAISSPQAIAPDEAGAFSYYGGAVARGSSFPDTLGVTNANMYSANTSNPPTAAEFILDSADATGRFEVSMKGNGAAFRVVTRNATSGQWQYATVGASFRTPIDGNGYLQLVTLGAPGTYTVRLEFTPGASFKGLNVGPTDAVRATNRLQRRVIVVGDSFTEPTVKDARTVADGATTSGSATVTSATAAFTSADVNRLITGTGIPGNAYIKAVTDASTVTISANATATATGVSVTVDQSFPCDGWPQLLSYALGADVWGAGKGGTGWVTPFNNVKFRDRLATDIIPYAPDEIWWAGGINDSGQTPASVAAEVTACLAQVTAALPNCKHVVLSPFWTKAATGVTANLWPMRDQMKTAALAVSAAWLDLLSLPGLPTISTVTTAQANSATSTVTVSGTWAWPRGSYVLLDRASTTLAEVRKVTNVTDNGNGTVTLTVSPNLGSTHAAGATADQVGPAFLTGTGRQGSLANDGTADRYVGSDSTHPTVKGHRNITDRVVALYRAAIVA